MIYSNIGKIQHTVARFHHGKLALIRVLNGVSTCKKHQLALISALLIPVIRAIIAHCTDILKKSLTIITLSVQRHKINQQIIYSLLARNFIVSRLPDNLHSVKAYESGVSIAMK